MAKQVQYRRGTTVQHSTFTGALGEVTVDTTKNVVVVHDGSTTGGIPMATNAEVVALSQALTSNAATQAAAINSLTTNAAVQSASIDQINANVAAANAVVNSVANLQNITTHIGPDLNNTRDLGFSDRKWRNVLVSNLVSGGSFAFANGTPISFNAINASISSLESNATAQAQALNTLDANLGTATTNITTLQSNASGQSTEIVGLRANIEAANAAIISITTGAGLVSQSELQSNLTAVNVAISTLDANLGTATTNITNLQSNAAGQSTEISGLRANITAANVEIDNLRANITAANALIPSIGNFTFTGNTATVPVNGTMELSAINNTTLESKLTLSPTTTSELYAANVLRVGVSYGSGFEKYWTFGADGSVTWPDASIQTTAFTTIVVTNLQSNIAAANVEIDGLRANVTAANIEIGSLQSNIAAANLEINSLRSNITAANGAITSIDANLGTATTNISTLQTNSATQATEITNLDANIAAANLEISSLQSNIASANLEISSLQSNISAANIEIGSLQSNVTAANIEIGSLQSNVTAANVEINSLRSNITAANSEISSLATAIGPTGLTTPVPSGESIFELEENPTIKYVLADVSDGNLIVYLSSNLTTGRQVTVSAFMGNGATDFGANIIANTGSIYGTGGSAYKFVANNTIRLIFNGTDWWRI
jgi:predicted  nucleic acid-binding Zn-ribbon protein